MKDLSELDKCNRITDLSRVAYKIREGFSHLISTDANGEMRELADENFALDLYLGSAADGHLGLVNVRFTCIVEGKLVFITLKLTHNADYTLERIEAVKKCVVSGLKKHLPQITGGISDEKDTK